MKKVSFPLFVGGALAILFAGVAVQAQNTTSSDKTFVKSALQGSLAEVNYAKLALQKSKDPNVTEFATKMVHDHE
ncbi:MAG TPA: DUF4142 domain-containing protein, partial [Terriglobales bacterium]|nr:DUF4142 domain-containing protein [Terriglobales bacterium]